MKNFLLLHKVLDHIEARAKNLHFEYDSIDGSDGQMPWTLVGDV